MKRKQTPLQNKWVKNGPSGSKADPNETAKSQPTKKPKADERQRNKKGPTARKGWKGYVEMSREEFERDLALKEKEDYKALPQKRGRKPKIDSIYTV